MKNNPFERPRRLEFFYQTEIGRLLDKYMSLPTFETLGELNSRLVEYGQARGFFKAVAGELAKRMVTMVAMSNAQSWRTAATKASKGRLIHSMLRSNLSGMNSLNLDRLIQENSTLITSLPAETAATVSKRVMELQRQGFRSTDIVDQIRQYMPRARAYQIQRMARTEVAKADTAITRTRAISVGAHWYQWKTSHDARVRESHKLFSDVLVNWNDAPAPESMAGEESEGHYHAGNIYNCRCVTLPLISLAEIKFPARVYMARDIKRLTAPDFESLIRRELAA